MLCAGERFEGYVVDGLLGHGGYATVYRVHDADEPGRVKALKILDDPHHHQAQMARLRREFDLAHGLRHRSIVTMHERGSGWLTMELVDGGNAADIPTEPERLTALAQIADALDYSHNRRIVHCDVKPANILVDPDVDGDFARAVLVDFGNAVTITDDICRRPTPVDASLPYSAPELLTGHAPTEATDEYALACTAVELLTGSPPFRQDSRVGLVQAHLREPPPRLSKEFPRLPRAFDAILAKAMAKAPGRRYQSCREFVALIVRALHTGSSVSSG